MARCWPGDAMLKLDPWRFASPSRASKRSWSRMLRWARLRRQALARLPTGPKSKHLQSKSSLLASGLPLQRRRPFAHVRRARRRPKLAPRAKAGQGGNKLACSPCWGGRRGRRLPPSCASPIGSSIRCAASSLAWCAKSSALICARRRSAGTGSIASSTAAVYSPLPAPRVVAQLECHGTRGDRSGTAGSSVARQRDRASARSRCRATASPMAYGVQAASTPSPAPSPAVSYPGLSAARGYAGRKQFPLLLQFFDP